MPIRTCPVCGFTDVDTMGRCVHCMTWFDVDESTNTVKDVAAEPRKNSWLLKAEESEAAAASTQTSIDYWGPEEAGFAYKALQDMQLANAKLYRELAESVVVPAAVLKQLVSFAEYSSHSAQMDENDKAALIAAKKLING